MAVRADGSTDRLSRTTSLPTASSFTMMGWFKISVDRNDYSSFFNYGTGTTKKTLQTNGTGTALVTWDGMFEVSTGQSLTVGTWAHVAMTYNGSNLVPYVDAVAGGAGGSGSGNPGSPIEIFQSESSEWFNGSVAAVKIYSAVLTAAEIAQEMRQYLPVRTLNLNSFYPCLSVADDQVDFSGAGLTLTVGGTLATEDGPPIPWKSASSRLVYVEDVAPGGDVEGSASITLGAVTSTATGTVDLAGQATATLGSLTSVATGTVALSGQAASTLGAVTSVATGTVALSGQATPTLGAATVTATGTLPLAGSASPTLGALTSTGTGTVALVGQASVTLGAATLDAESVLGDAPIEGALSRTLGALTPAATGTIALQGALGASLGELALAAAAAVSISGQMSTTLGAATTTATSTLGIGGSVTVTLGAASLAATGVLGEFEEDLPSQVSVRGSYVPSVAMTGSYVPSIPLTGSKG